MNEKPRLKLATENGKNLHLQSEINLDSASGSLEDALDSVYKLTPHEIPAVGVESRWSTADEVSDPEEENLVNKVGDEKYIQVETKGHHQSEKIDDEDFETLEEVEKSFSAAKTIFEELSKHSENLTEVTMGERMIHLFEDNKEQDKNLAKKNKEKYLKHLHLSIDRIRSEMTEISETTEKSIKEPQESRIDEGTENPDKALVTEKENNFPLHSTDNIPKSEVENPEPPGPTPYEKARTELLSAKKEFQAKKSAYDSALDEYYQGEAKASLFEKAGKFFGFKPDFPPELAQLEKEYKDLRGAYANLLNSALIERSKVSYASYKNEKDELITPETPLANKPYDINSDSTKVSYARKFILKPNEQLLKKQEAIALSEAQKSRMNRILALMSKNKWAFRAGIVTLAGLGAAATGGVAAFALGAGLQAARIAGGTLAGAAAAGGVGLYKQKGVNKAIEGVNTATENIKKEFSLDNLNELENELVTAQKIKDEKIRDKKTASIIAAVAAGGAVSGSWHAMDSGDVVANVSEKISDVTDEASKRVDSAWQNNPALSDLVDAERSPVPALETIGESVDTFKLPITKEISISNYDINGVKDSEIILQDIKLSGENNPAESFNALDRDKVENTIRMYSSDLLSAHPNMSQVTLEKLLLEKLQNQYSGARWWDEAKITGVNIGDIKVSILEEGVSVDLPDDVKDISEVTVDENEGGYKLENEKVPANDLESVNKYEVVKGDTLWDITEKAYEQELKGLTEAEKNQVLGYLLEKARTNKELLETLNLRSGDVELIYPKEVINIGPLGEELKHLIELQRSGDLPEYSRQASLEIKTDDSVENRVPINFSGVRTPLEMPDTDAFKVSADSVFNTPPPITPPNYFYDNPMDTLDRGENMAVTPEKFPEPPTSSNGNYFETPEYKQRVIEVFGTEKNYNLAFNNRISDIESKTYDMFTRGLYDSPYTFMKSMTLEQIEKFDSRDSLEIRGDLGTNIKYETYLAWVQKIKDIQASGVPYHPETRLSDLFSRYVVEDMVERTNAKK